MCSKWNDFVIKIITIQTTNVFYNKGILMELLFYK